MVLVLVPDLLVQRRCLVLLISVLLVWLLQVVIHVVVVLAWLPLLRCLEVMYMLAICNSQVLTPRPTMSISGKCKFSIVNYGSACLCISFYFSCELNFAFFVSNEHMQMFLCLFCKRSTFNTGLILCSAKLIFLLWALLARLFRVRVIVLWVVF